MADNGVVEEIKNKCNIVDVIGDVVSLKKAGANYKGLCPFHNEKTPSFSVSEKGQYYHCFGCGKSGDVFTFMQEYYNMDFMGALEKLADRYGVEIKDSYSVKGKDKKKYYEINLQAARYYFRAFRGRDSRPAEYMEKRGISRETLHRFGIGWADDSWSSLLEFLKKQGYDEKDIEDAGLTSAGKGRIYDKFRSRIIFPIQNTRERMIGFGGRIVGEGEPKYLNSPESPVFRKKDNLYGLNITGKEISKAGCAILVEGYMDVISLYDCGIKNVTASLGTSLTENQAALLKRYSSDVCISYDGDSAGVKAAVRATEILYKAGCRVKVIHIDGGQDPDEFVKEKGREAFEDKIRRAPGFVEYRFDRLQEKYSMDNTEERVRFLNESIDVLKMLRPAERDIHIKELALRAQVSEGAIRNELGEESVERSKPETQEEKKTRESLEPKLMEKTLIKVMASDGELMTRRDEVRNVFTSHYGNEIFRAMEEVYEQEGNPDKTKIMDGLSMEAGEIFADILKNIPTAGAEESIFDDCIRNTEAEAKKKEIQELQWKISMADENKNQREINLWSKRLMELQKEMKMGANK